MLQEFYLLTRQQWIFTCLVAHLIGFTHPDIEINQIEIDNGKERAFYATYTKYKFYNYKEHSFYIMLCFYAE